MNVSYTQFTLSDTNWGSDADSGNGLVDYTPLKYTSYETSYTTYSTYDCSGGCSPTSQSIGASGYTPTRQVMHALPLPLQLTGCALHR